MQGQEAKHLDLVGDNNTWKRPIIDEGGVDKTDIPFHGHIFLSVDGRPLSVLSGNLAFASRAIADTTGIVGRSKRCGKYGHGRTIISQNKNSKKLN